MANSKLTRQMVEVLRYAAGSHQGSAGHVKVKTENALMERGLLTYDHSVKALNGDPWLYPVLTVAGWSWLWDQYGIERPDDPGRMSLIRAWDDAHPVAEEVESVKESAGRT